MSKIYIYKHIINVVLVLTCPISQGIFVKHYAYFLNPSHLNVTLNRIKIIYFAIADLL